MKYLAILALMFTSFFASANWVENKVGGDAYAVSVATDGNYELGLHISTKTLNMYFVEKTPSCSNVDFIIQLPINGLNTEVYVYCYDNWHVAEVIDPDSVKILFELLDNRLEVQVGEKTVTYYPYNLVDILFKEI